MNKAEQEPGERWGKVERIFEAALERPEEQRHVFLDTQLAGDPTLRAEIESLLEANAEATHFLEVPALNAWTELWRSRPAIEAGTRIGPYRIVRPIGQGGMGTVYLAGRADDEYHQQIAIKLANPAIARDLLRSFRGERQILANLEHPNIARLLDGGTTDDGLPYLVMEYVEGTAIDDYCEHHNLQAAARLELFGSVCAAVEYAHRNLVVHRDLKPQNILITEGGVPKLLDFGIAKLLEPGAAAAGSEVTQLGLRPLTPNYASPEQLRGQQITTATDIYSLGVLLYRLLTGRPPRIFESLAPPEIERVLAHEPPRPELDRDLDGIVLKALDEQPDRRYASVEQLSEDLRRYAAGLPILARPHTLGYRAAKFLRRHRLAVAVAVTVAALLVGFAVDRGWQAAKLAQERDRARIEGAKARELSTFLVDLLQDSDPWQASGREVTVREVLDRGSEEIRQRFDDEPELRGMLLDTMGSIYLNLALFEKARPLLEEGLAERQRILPADHPDIAVSLANLGELGSDKAEYQAAEDFHRQALAIRRASSPEGPRVADSLHQLGMVLFLKGEYVEAERLHREALALRLKVLGEDHIDVAGSLHALAIVYTEIGRFEAAEALFERSLETKRRLLGGDHPDVAATLGRLASLMRRQGELERAEQLFRQALDIQRPIFGELHPQVLTSSSNLASVLFAKGDYKEAEKIYRQVLEVGLRVLGEDHRDIATVHYTLAKVMRAQGDLAAAETFSSRALEIVRRSLPPEHPGGAYPLQLLGILKLEAGDPERAEPLLREALGRRQGALPPGHPETSETRSLLGSCLVQLGRFDEAEKLLTESTEALTTGENEPLLAAARERLAALYDAWGRPDRAAEIRQQVRQPSAPLDD